MSGISVLEQAKSHYKQVKKNEIRSLQVPEWKTELFFKPASQLQNDKFLIHVKEGEMAKAQAWLIISRSLDADGRRVFTDSSFKQLYQEADSRVIRRVADFILEGDNLEDIEPDEAAKN